MMREKNHYGGYYNPHLKSYASNQSKDFAKNDEALFISSQPP